MCLGTVVRLGYAIVFITLLLTVWVSITFAKVSEYPPCVFNPLCTCSKAVPDLGIVLCKDVPLPRLPPPINSSKIFTLHLENNELRSLEPFFFQATGLYHLEVSRNPIPDVPNEAFAGLERSLWELELRYNQLIMVPGRAMRYLKKLKKLDLTGNEISEIYQENFRGLESSLQSLILAGNAIASLPADVFGPLTNLETLDLSGNDIVTLELTTFRDGPPHLSTIYLADNQLMSIPYHEISGLKQLRTLDLTNNRITHLHSGISDRDMPVMPMSLDTLRLDYNQISYLPPGSFQYFEVLNKTYLNGNPIFLIEADAFKNARIRELSLRDCGITGLSPAAFNGLEPYLQYLDLGGNNLTDIPRNLLHEFDYLRYFFFSDNHVSSAIPGDYLDGFQYSLYGVDFSGKDMSAISLKGLQRMRSIRSMNLSKLLKSELEPEDFNEYALGLEEISIHESNLKKIKNHVFKHVRGIKYLDFSENNINSFETDAFLELGHSLLHLNLANGLSSSVNSIPTDALGPLTSLQKLDLSNNHIRSVPETSFHFLKNLQILRLQDNQIDQIYKGTFQGEIHSSLEQLHLSFNNLKTVKSFTFVDLTSLERLYLDDNHVDTIESDAFRNLNHLKVLTLRGNKIRDIADEAFQNLPELQDLDLAYNKLQSFDFACMDQVGVLASFQMNISHNNIQKLEVNITSFNGRDSHMAMYHSNIKVLDISYNNISHIRNGYLRPVEMSLTHLHLSHNNMKNTTRNVFGNIPHLQWLDLSYNDLTELDFDTFRNTQRLQVIMFGHNALTDIPAELFRRMSNLRIVDFSYNKLRTVPDGLFLEEGLESLDLSHNQLGRLPLSSLGFSAPVSLIQLDLSHNYITSLQGPDSFTKFWIGRMIIDYCMQLPNRMSTYHRALHQSRLTHTVMRNFYQSLSRLDLSHNRLVRVEDSTFSTLTHLTSLDLSHNAGLVLENHGRSFKGLENTLLELSLANISLTTVPELSLQHLRSLDLSQNILTDVPLDMTVNMTSLRHLDLSYNDLTAVPMVTVSLPQLRKLFMAGNPVSMLTNTTMIGAAPRLRELDIRQLPLEYFETGALTKMTSLRTIRLSPYKHVNNFNIPQVLQFATGVRNLHIESHEMPGLDKEMYGTLPTKVRNITLTGMELRHLPSNILEGVRSPVLHFGIHNSSVEMVSKSIFEKVGFARNITVDVRNNSIRMLGNPSTADIPNEPRLTFLKGLKLSDNMWSCDCELGWVEVWQRKKRQYLCQDYEDQEYHDDYDDDDYDGTYCHQAEDDLRMAICSNKNNASLLEVLKTEIECGWGSRASTSFLISPTLIMFLTVLVTYTTVQL